jgi:hypothetical protein
MISDGMRESDYSWRVTTPYSINVCRLVERMINRSHKSQDFSDDLGLCRRFSIFGALVYCVVAGIKFLTTTPPFMTNKVCFSVSMF